MHTPNPSAHACTQTPPYGLPQRSASPSTAQEFRAWLQDLQWDGRSRLNKWLPTVLDASPHARYSLLQRWYLSRVGRYIAMAHVARIMDPGCKFDYCVVLDGPQGLGKSTLVQALVSSGVYSDHAFDPTGKDNHHALRGIVAYELSELDAFRRADRQALKAFLTAQADLYRSTYARLREKHPRQFLVWCTTSSNDYLRDSTGDRRFWPVPVKVHANHPWLQEHRAQIFAEALHQYRKGKRYTPSRLETALLFKPEFDRRVRQAGGAV